MRVGAASPDRQPPVVAVVGPTAAGKSELAVALALALRGWTGAGEVVNADSMQVYRGMDIGTAKLPPDERRGVRHHVLDLLDVSEPSTVAEFQGWARAAIDDCRHRGVVPVVVGGSALYLRAVLDEFDFPGTDAEVRERLELELAQRGVAAMHADLALVDPESAADHPAQQRPADRARARGRRDHRSARSAPPCRPTPTRSTGSSSSASTYPARSSTPGSSSGYGGCGAPGSSTRSAPCGTPGWPAAAPRAALSATGRCWPTSTGACTEEEAFHETVDPDPALRPTTGLLVPA